MQLKTQRGSSLLETLFGLSLITLSVTFTTSAIKTSLQIYQHSLFQEKQLALLNQAKKITTTELFNTPTTKHFAFKINDQNITSVCNPMTTNIFQCTTNINSTSKTFFIWLTI